MIANRLFGGLVVGLSLGFAACGSESLTIPPSTGTLQITTSTVGSEPDPDGYTLQVDALQPQAIGSTATVSVEELAPGTHNVVLTGLAANCSVADNPRSVSIAVGETTTAAFELTCGGTTGALEITAQTSGAVPDADGYAISFDGTDRGPIGANAVVTLSNLAPGSHVVGLTGVAANCQVQGDNLRVVTITAGATATLTFAVTCIEPPASVGVLQITTATTGQDLDADGYQFAVDGGQGQPIGRNGSTSLVNTAVGPHSVVLSQVAANCTVDDASKSATVLPGATATVAFTVTCAAVGPTVGSIRVTTTTTGPNQDADGYQFAIDGGASQPIEVKASTTVGNIAAGAHSVVLSNVAGNCSIDDGSQNVTVTPGAISDVAFSVTCTSTGPSASQSSMLAAPKSIAAGTGSSTITVTVRNAGGGPVAGTTVTLASSGSGNTISPASSGSDVTNQNGVATFTFSSTVGDEDKTITATASGVILNDTEVITVFRRNSAIQITGDQNDPSTSGEFITVAFTVTVAGGGTPTGQVNVFSLDEAGVGCNVDVSAGSCTFALNTPGLQHLEADYSGDGQFLDSFDGEEHTVTPAAPANQAPTAVSDAYTGTVGTPLVISDPQAGLLGNDTDPEGDGKFVASHTDPSNGILTLADDGTLTYGPNDATVTSDAFTYTIKDDKGAVGNAADVTITLSPAAAIAVR